MTVVKKQHKWASFLRFFSTENSGRKTRLGVFESSGEIMEDYWLECGLPLSDVEIDSRSERPTIRISVGELKHEVRDAVKLAFQFSLSGEEDGIDITDVHGRQTILRFEANIS